MGLIIGVALYRHLKAIFSKTAALVEYQRSELQPLTLTGDLEGMMSSRLWAHKAVLTPCTM
jgi:hypothetical protein